MRKKPFKGYICGTDPIDISLGATDVVIFPSIAALKKKRSCWKECGILEIDINAQIIVKRPGNKGAK